LTTFLQKVRTKTVPERADDDPVADQV